MNTTIYVFQWSIMEYAGEWEDAPVKIQLSKSEAVKIAEYLQGKYPDRKWRVVEKIDNIVWQSDSEL
jgi:hypothetical protein